MQRRILGRRLFGVLAAVTMAVAAPAPAMAAPAPAVAAPVLRLPAPTGPYAVGVRTTSLADPARIDELTLRPRRLPIRIWYPAVRPAAGHPAAYMNPAVRLELERELGLPAGMLELDTHATADAPPRPSVRGVLLMQHGGNTLASFQTGQVVDLASRGWAVVTVEHPHESYAVEEADGTLIKGTDAAPFTDRIADGSLVLAALPRLVPQAGPRTPIGMFGHSRGGAATAEMMLHHPGIAAGVDVDGSPRGDVLTAGLDRPLGFLLGVEQPVASLAPFLAVLRGPHPVRELPVDHYGFTDWVVLLPQVELAVPGLGVALEQALPSGTAGDPGAGLRSLTTQRRFLSAFFDRYLSLGLDGPAGH